MRIRLRSSLHLDKQLHRQVKLQVIFHNDSICLVQFCTISNISLNVMGLMEMERIFSSYGEWMDYGIDIGYILVVGYWIDLFSYLFVL